VGPTGRRPAAHRQAKVRRMGMQDRDWYQEKLRKQNAPWQFGPAPRPWSRPSSPLWKGLAIAGALALTYWLGVKDGASKMHLAIPQARPESAAPPAHPALQHQARPVDPSFQIRGEREPSPRVAEPFAAVTASTPATSTVYLCKGYSGGMFWSSAVCSSRRATIDRMFTVSGQLDWNEQVADAERQWGEVRQLYAAQQGATTAGGIAPSAAGSALCAALDDQIRRIDAAARQPQSAWAQDQLRQERQAVRSKQAELRC
jgi:hypothetical protein